MIIRCSWIPQTGSGKVLEDFEQQTVLAICPWNPKQQKRSKKNSYVAKSVTKLIFACCGIRLQFTKGTVWPRYDFAKKTTT